MLKKILAVIDVETIFNERVIAKGQPIVFLNYDVTNRYISREDREALWALSLNELLDKEFLLKGSFFEMYDDMLVEVIDNKKNKQRVFYKDIFPLDERWTDTLKCLVMTAIENQLSFSRSSR